MISTIKSTLVNTDYGTSTTTNVKTIKGDFINVHGEMTLTIGITCFRCIYNFNFCIAEINDILGLDLLMNKIININCRHLTEKDNVTKSTSTCNDSPSHNPISAVSLVLSQRTDTVLRNMMEQHSSISGDVYFKTPCTHNNIHRIAVSSQSKFVRLESFALKSNLSQRLDNTSKRIIKFPWTLKS